MKPSRSSKNVSVERFLADPQISGLLELTKTNPADAEEIHDYIGQQVAQYSDETWCFKELEKMKWPKGILCGHCNSKDVAFVKSRFIYQCNECRRQFSLTTNTIFHRSRITSAQLYFLIIVVYRTGAWMKKGWKGYPNWKSEPVDIPDRAMLKIRLEEIMFFLGTKSKGTGMRIYRLLAEARLNASADATLDQFVTSVLAEVQIPELITVNGKKDIKRKTTRS